MKPDALAHLLSNELSPLRRFSMSLTHDRDRADDLVQDTIERAMQKAHLFDGANLRAWLFTICRRIFLNQVRKQKLTGTSVTVEDAPQNELKVVATQESTIEFHDVAIAFDKLSPKDKTILALVAVEGLKYQEAADLLDVAVGTIRSRLSRARTKLLTLMETDSGKSA